MRLIYLIPLYIFAAGICHGENFTFKDGSRIDGTLKSVDAPTLEIETSSGTVKVNRNSIALIDFSQDTVARKIICKETHYPDGRLHTQACYLDDKLHGLVKIYRENGQPMLEQNFKAGAPDGFQREYNEDGSLKSELFYSEGQLARQGPKGRECFASSVKPVPLETAAVAPQTARSPASADFRQRRTSLMLVSGTGSPSPKAEGGTAFAVTQISVKTKRLARGTSYTFYRGGKHIGTQVLDKNYNVTGRSGRIPDGVVRTYFKNGLPEIEMIFLNDNLNGPAKFYDESGNLESEVTYMDNKVIDRKPAP